MESTVVTVDQADPHFAPRLGAVGADVRVGDLRTVPMPPRSFDVVHCALLLHHISHVELVLDRFTAALRPGGLLLLRIRDRDCAAGLLDRLLPQWARRLVWARLDPVDPGRRVVRHPWPGAAPYRVRGSGRATAGRAVRGELSGFVFRRRDFPSAAKRRSLSGGNR